ncbi:unnamed protein product [Symbiodinium sp. KB8]|nr:unnamed protein product [Symbiodinium sp. KB8]
MNKASALAEHLELSMADVRMEDLSSLCQSCSRRITSCRFVDTPDIKNLIARRKRQHGREARELAKQIADTRRRAKKEWLATLLQKSAEGDYRAIAYFKKRNTAMYTQGSYCIRAGGRSKAIADLRFFYQRKYTPPDPTIRGLPRAIFHERAGPILNPAPFTLEEVRDVAFMCKHNKSTGADGISYEALQMPIVLSSTVAKVGGVPQRQILDAACAVQQAIRLSEQMNWRKCKYIQTPGILIGFQLSCQAVLAARWLSPAVKPSKGIRQFLRAHKGILLNEIADAFAKTATQLRHYRKTFCTLDRCVFGTEQAFAARRPSIPVLTAPLLSPPTAAMEQVTGPRDVREHVQAFMDTARPVAVIPQGTLLLTAGLGLLVMVLFGWGALTSFLRSLVTNMQSAIRNHMDTLLQELNEQTKKSLLLEIGNATEDKCVTCRRSSGTSPMLLAKISMPMHFVKNYGSSLRPVLAQWSQIQGDKSLKIFQDGIAGAAPSATASTTTTQPLEDKMKDYHAAVMAQLQDLHGAVTTTTLNKVDKLHTTVDAVAAETKTLAGYMREDHAILVRVRDRVDECPRNICEDTAKTLLWVSGQESELKDRTHKIESQITGMLDVVNDVGTALERHSETMGMRLRMLNDIQGGLEKVLATLASRSSTVPTAPQQPPHFAQASTFGRSRVPPAPTHTPTILEDFSGQQPIVQTNAHSQPSSASPVLVTNLDALTQVVAACQSKLLEPPTSDLSQLKLRCRDSLLTLSIDLPYFNFAVNKYLCWVAFTTPNWDTDGLWVQDPVGTIPKQHLDQTILGRVQSLRMPFVFDARRLLHAGHVADPTRCQERLVLVAFCTLHVSTLSEAIRSRLFGLGFNVPSIAECHVALHGCIPGAVPRLRQLSLSEFFALSAAESAKHDVIEVIEVYDSQSQ